MKPSGKTTAIQTSSWRRDRARSRAALRNLPARRFANAPIAAHKKPTAAAAADKMPAISNNKKPSGKRAKSCPGTYHHGKAVVKTVMPQTGISNALG
jgi:hypothetical protein